MNEIDHNKSKLDLNNLNELNLTQLEWNETYLIVGVLLVVLIITTMIMILKLKELDHLVQFLHAIIMVLK